MPSPEGTGPADNPSPAPGRAPDRARAELPFVQAYFDNIVALSEDAVISVDTDQRICLFNQGAEAIFGYPARAMLGQPLDVLVPARFQAVHRTHLAGFLSAPDTLRAMNDRRPIIGVRQDGTEFPAEATITKFQVQGHTVLTVRLQDITDRTRAEDTLRTLAAIVECSEDAILAKDLAGTIISWNAGAEHLYGYPAAEVLGRSVSLLVPPERQGELATLCARVGSGERIAGHETERITKAGTRLAVSLTLSPIKDRTGATIGISAIARDITERMRAAAALRQSHEALEQRVRDRTAALSHAVERLEQQAAQVRQLATALTVAEQRERQRIAAVLHDEQQQLLAAANLRLTRVARRGDAGVRDACAELGGLLTQVIASSRSLARDLSPPLLPGTGLCAALHWLAQWMNEQHGLQVTLRATADPVPQTEGLAIMLFQGVRELLFNVVKHAQVPTAEVALTQREDQLQIQVADLGVGFEAARPQPIDGPAAGLGLRGIRHRLELLGGHLAVDSTPGHGSRFTLSAPVRPGTAAAPPGAGPLPPPSPVVPDARHRVRVLLVDDHAVVRQALAALLRNEPDLEVVGEAANGQLAVDLARQLRPDVVLMDINMPVMNGVEATRHICRDLPAVRVIGLSMYEEGVHAPTLRALGAAGYVSKSAPPETLLAAIRAGAPRPPFLAAA